MIAKFLEIERIGRTIACPVCESILKYTWLSGVSNLVGIYSTKGDSVLVSRAFKKTLDEMVFANDIQRLQFIQDFISTHYPDESFDILSNVQCTKCHYKFPYSYENNLQARLQDTQIVLLDGVKLVEDERTSIIHVLLPEQ